MRISDWSSDVCSSDLGVEADFFGAAGLRAGALAKAISFAFSRYGKAPYRPRVTRLATSAWAVGGPGVTYAIFAIGRVNAKTLIFRRSEEHTSELQSLMRISYAVFWLKKKKNTKI